MTLSHPMIISPCFSEKQIFCKFNKLKFYTMEIEKGNIYHIYNQGNNRQRLFFKRDNYIFFLKKLRKHILPFADILAWCLMPNHFHLMVLVNQEISGSATQSRAPTSQTLNHSIGVMLASYTRAINKQQKTSGSLFRQKTKAECVNCFNGPTPNFLNDVDINISFPENEYPQVCFNYIHNNPVKAKLVKDATEWEFSSAMDYASLRDGTLVNKIVAEEYLDF